MPRQSSPTLGLFAAVVASMLCFCALMARIESEGELYLLTGWDVLIGFLFALAFLSLQDQVLLDGRVRNRTVSRYIAAVIWVAVAGGLIFHHHEQVRVRLEWARSRLDSRNP